MRVLIILMGVMLQWTFVFAQNLVRPSNPYLSYVGNIDFSDNEQPSFAWPGISIRGRFSGSSLTILLENIPTTTDPSSQSNFYNVFIDDSLYKVIRSTKDKHEYLIGNDLPEKEHTFEIYKRTESIVGVGIFKGLVLSKNGKLLPYKSSRDHRIEFIGNSITCGYGVEGPNKECRFSDSTENNYKSYAAVSARQLNADAVFTSYSGKGIYQNYNQDKGLNMFDLYQTIYPDKPKKQGITRNWSPELVVINLGTNDFSHVNPDSLLWTHRYLSFIDSLEQKYPTTKIICCVSQMMSDYWPEGNKARTTIKNYLSAIVGSRKKQGDNDVYLFEFTTQGRYGYGCDWHPNEIQNKFNAEELTAFIKKMFGW